ncbi:hypothetical protein [Anaerovirgula multivorans]|uniref:hypothetical protein n=1 Tax=Anaerovirgula multivorans TaxID=312168 RepID=UPI001130CC76|nr:hypothetical protein [Anaerovirgula multivorans]
MSYVYRDKGSVPLNQGLVVFHRGEFIKSFVLTPDEVTNIIEHGQTVVKDIGYILSFTSTNLQLFELCGYGGAGAIHETNFKVRRTKEWVFEIMQPLDYFKLDLSAETYGYKGIQLAVITALQNPIESENMIRCDLPNSGYALIFDYTLGGDSVG